MKKERSLSISLPNEQPPIKPVRRFSRRTVVGVLVAGAWILTGAVTIADCYQEQKKNHAKESNK